MRYRTSSPRRWCALRYPSSGCTVLASMTHPGSAAATSDIAGVTLTLADIGFGEPASISHPGMTVAGDRDRETAAGK